MADALFILQDVNMVSMKLTFTAGTKLFNSLIKRVIIQVIKYTLNKLNNTFTYNFNKSYFSLA